MNDISKSGDATVSIEDARVRKVELVISTLLRVGVVTSLILVSIGFVVMFLQHPQSLLSSDQLSLLTSMHAEFPHTIADVFHGVAQFQGQAIIAIGLLTLIATPVMRVAVAIFAFIFQDDMIFTVITTVVLLLLFLSFFLGAVE